MKFMRNINNEISNVELTLVDSGFTAPTIPESCGEWLEQKGDNYKIKILTYEYSVAAVAFLKEKIDGQCNQ